MENNILELECSEQPISAYQAIGFIDCNISAQGSGTFRNRIYYQNDASRAVRSDGPITLVSPYNRHFGNPSQQSYTDHIKQSFSQGNERLRKRKARHQEVLKILVCFN